MGVFGRLRNALFGTGAQKVGKAGRDPESQRPPGPVPASETVRIRVTRTPLPTHTPTIMPSALRPPTPVPAAGHLPESKYLSAADQPRLLVPDENGVLPVTIRDGFFVYIPTGQMMPPANRVLSSQGIESFRVRGTKYHRGAKSADTSPGQSAVLRREPDNEFDPNAVAVYGRNPSGRLAQVGYVNKGVAPRLAKRMDAGEPLEALFMRGNPPGEWEESPCVVIVDEVFRAKIRWPD